MPWDILVLTRAAPRSDVIVTNSGDGTLTISTLDITGPNATSFDDFSVTGCAAMPCTVTTSLCGGDTTNFEVVYANNDISTQDAVELRIRSNDATNPEHILVIHGVDSPCLFPNPVITVVTQQPRVGAVVEVNGLLSNPGGQSGVTNTIVRWDWQWLFAPTPSPAFTGQNTPTVQFTPTQSGSYFIGLNVTNDCGAMSQGSAAEMINVSNN